MHNGHSTIYPAQHQPLFVDHANCQQIQFEDKDDTAETSFCEETQQCEEKASLKRAYIIGDSSVHNTLPLLRHDGRRDPCLSDADWESVPAADSEKFI